MTRAGIAVALFATFLAPSRADDGVPVPGSGVKFPRALALPVDGKPVSLRLTGVAMRTRLVFNVYAVGSYVPAGTVVKSADDVVALNEPKLLYLVMERSVSGRDMCDAFKTAIAASHPGDKFAAELAQLAAAIGGTTAEKGDHVSLFYTPGGGLRVQVVGKVDVTIKGAGFAAAVWGVYLGPTPIDDGLKRGLVGQLGK